VEPGAEAPDRKGALNLSRHVREAEFRAPFL
jgi:hypothetical protein